MRIVLAASLAMVLTLALIPEANADRVVVRARGFGFRAASVNVNVGGAVAVGVGHRTVVVNGFNHFNAGFHHHAVANVAVVRAPFVQHRVAFVGTPVYSGVRVNVGVPYHYGYAAPVAVAAPALVGDYGCDAARYAALRAYAPPAQPQAAILSEEVTVTDTDGKVTKTFRQFR